MISFFNALDSKVLNFLYAHREMHAIYGFIYFTELGSIVLVLGLTAALSIILARRKWYAEIAGLMISVFGSGTVAYALKYIVHRARPGSFFQAFTETGYSLPSGHSTESAAFYGFLIYMVIRHSQKGAKRNIVVSFLLTLIALIGFSRLYLGVHYLTDVLAGWVIAAVFVFIGIWATKWISKNFSLTITS